MENQSDFYDEEGRVADPNTAHILANMENQLRDKEKELKSMHDNPEILTEGFLKIGKEYYDKNPELFIIKEDSDKNKYIISKPIKKDLPFMASKTRLIVFSKNGIARVTGMEDAVDKYLGDIGTKITPEKLDLWGKFLGDTKREYYVNDIVGLNYDLSISLAGGSGLNLQRITESMYKSFLEEPIQQLIEENEGEIQGK